MALLSHSEILQILAQVSPCCGQLPYPSRVQRAILRGAAWRPGRQQPPRQSRVGAKQAESHADRPRLSAKAFLPGSHHALVALSILPRARWPSCEAPPPQMPARGAAATQTGPRLTSGPPSIQRRCDGQPLPSPHHSTPRARARTAAGEHRDAGGQRLGSAARQGRRGQDHPHSELFPHFFNWQCSPISHTGDCTFFQSAPDAPASRPTPAAPSTQVCSGDGAAVADGFLPVALFGHALAQFLQGAR